MKNSLTSNFHNRSISSINGYLNWKQENINLINNFGLRMVSEFYWQRSLFGNLKKSEVFK